MPLSMKEMPSHCCNKHNKKQTNKSVLHRHRQSSVLSVVQPWTWHHLDPQRDKRPAELLALEGVLHHTALQYMTVSWWRSRCQSSHYSTIMYMTVSWWRSRCQSSHYFLFYCTWLSAGEGHGASHHTILLYMTVSWWRSRCQSSHYSTVMYMTVSWWRSRCQSSHYFLFYCTWLSAVKVTVPVITLVYCTWLPASEGHGETMLLRLLGSEVHGFH